MSEVTPQTDGQERPVVVCTKYRGVFFGYGSDTNGSTVTLARARMCVFWDQSMHGVLGLASQGPSEKCRVGEAVSSIELHGITAVLEMTPEAVKRWEAGLWE